MKLPAVGGSTQGYMESPEDSFVVWESTWTLRPAHALAGWVFLLERPGEHKHPAEPHMKGVIREQHPALTKSGQRSKAASSIKPHRDQELLLGMDSCGTSPHHCIPEPLTAGRECQAKATQAGFPPSPIPSKFSCSSGK